jgi:purine-binding chemotaxis protein CheW
MAAQRARQAEGTRMSILVLIATIAGQRVAIDAARIESVVDLWQVVPVPMAPAHVLGLAAVRSRVLTVVDAAAAVGLRAGGTGNRALVMDVEGHSYALRVDAVCDVTAAVGAAMPFDPAAGENWAGIATSTIDTEFGFALMIDPARLISGTAAVVA